MYKVIKNFLTLIRFGNSVYPIASFLVGFAVSSKSVVFSASVFLSTVCIIIVHSVATLWNDMYDREVDALNGRPFFKKIYGTEAYRRYVVICCGLVIVSLALAATVGAAFLTLTAVLLLLSWWYSAPPLQLAYRPIASIAVLSFIGATMPLIMGASLSGMHWEIMYLALPWWGIRASVSVLKDYKDAAGDAKAQKKTFLLRFGARNVAKLSSLLASTLLVAFIGLVWGMGYVSGTQLAVLVAIASLLIYLRVPLFQPKASYKMLNKQFQRIAEAHILFDIVVLGCLLI